MKKSAITLTLLALAIFASVAACAEEEAAAENPEGQLDDAFKSIVAYELGQDGAPMERIIERVIAVQEDPAARNALADRLAALLSTGATFDCKRFVIRQLQVIGGDAQVPALAALLVDKKHSHLARYALEGIAGPVAYKALVDALGKTSGEVRVGIINTLGVRREAESVVPLAALLGDSDVDTAAAAATALAKIGGVQAARALNEALKNAGDTLRPAVLDACLTCADKFLAGGDVALAIPIYEQFFKKTEERHVRLGAFRGLVAAKGVDALPLVLDALASDDPVWQRAALAYVRVLPGQKATRTFAKQVQRLDGGAKVSLIAALAERGDQTALPVVKKALKSESEAVRFAALEAVAAFGDAASALTLAEIAASVSGKEQRAARSSLYALSAEGVDTAILEALDSAAPEIHAELVRSIAERSMRNAMATLLREAKGPNEQVVHEAFRGLGLLAGPDDMPSVAGLLTGAASDAVREEAERAVVSAARRIPPDRGPVDAVMAALKAEKKPEVRISLLRVLGEIAHHTSLEVLRAAMKGEAEEERRAAVQALANWPRAEVMADLLTIAKEPESEAQDVALNGYIRLLRQPSERPGEESVALFEEALKLARSKGAKRNVLSGLSDVHDLKALEIVERYLGDAELNREAAVAAEKIRKHFYAATASHSADRARNALDDNVATRWDTGTRQEPGQWFQVDLTREVLLRGIFLDAAGSSKDYPRGYEVYVFTDEGDMGEPVAAGEGNAAVTAVRFEPANGRYVRVVQTGKTDHWFWSIHEFRIVPK